jgi:hypothetical protein
MELVILYDVCNCSHMWLFVVGIVTSAIKMIDGLSRMLQ